ncbi:MAG TPA: glycogen-binding domain-containing protein [Bacteroidales bacterium]|nr:glycogen-binding domain-containing protein [Bacteroidales bacterium]HPT01668.1 glycogen-binding domain-containing protein [Bacteroidales bacterium]
MKKRYPAIALILFLMTVIHGIAQDKSGNICYVNSDRMYIRLDKRWSDARKKEISLLYNLDSTLIEQAFAGKILSADSLTWTVEQVNEEVAIISKPFIDGKQPSIAGPEDVLLLDDNLIMNPLLNSFLPSRKKFGINQFRTNSAIQFKNDTTRFFLPGYQEKNQVYFSGSFNNWSTTMLPMKKTGAGWEADLRLAAGKHLYKYIPDGQWIHDPFNKLKEHDGQGGYNSVMYCYNHTFRLDGYTDARNVIVTGSFNNWQKRQLKMNRIPGGWELPIYLEEGTYAYKFIVDGHWMTDPADTNVRQDIGGNRNSFLGIGDTVIFSLNGYDSAQQVFLAGSFNGWNPGELRMNKVPGGWKLPYVMGRGYFEYKFIVDGRWMPDPANPHTTGTGDYINSYFVLEPNYTFRLKHFSDAQNVIVTGSFNGWQTDNYQMTKQDGYWTFSTYLKPGKYTYKFIVDGTWLLDPDNDAWEENSQGTGNSVLWVEP